MRCEYCGWTKGHHDQCPNYEIKDTGHICIFCEEKIDGNKTYYKDYSDDYFCSEDCFKEYHGFEEVEDE